MRLGAAWLWLTLALACPAKALDCPLLKDQSAGSWAREFDRTFTVIFRARVTSVQFERIDDQLPVYAVGYHVLETIKGRVAADFVSRWEPWCDACNVETARGAGKDLVGKIFLVQGHEHAGHAASSFAPGWCWPFVALPFEWAKGDLLAGLRALKKR